MAKVSLPSNVEAERSVLGAMLLSANACNIAIASLTEDSFSDVDPRNKIIFHAMENLSKHEQIIDPQTVTNELINTNLLSAAGDSSYLLELMNSVINPENVEHYVAIVKDQQVLREFLLALQDVQKDYAEGKISDIGDFLANSQQTLTAITNRRSVGGFRKGGEIAKEVKLKIIAEAKRSNRSLTGVDTGFRGLNKLTHGWQAGDLIVLAARPSVGKTAFALNLAVNAASYKGEPVAFFSGEMDSTLVMKRILSSISRVSLSGNEPLTDRDLGKIALAVTEVERMNLYIDDKPNPKLGDIIAKSIKLKNSEPNLCAIFIDYINIIHTEKSFESRSLEVAEITSSLKELARTLKIPVIALAQVNRDADKNENGVPSMSNLKDSGSIEQDADIIMLMYRKDYYDNQGKRIVKGQSAFEQKMDAQVEKAKQAGPNKDSGSVTTINVTKNRNGSTGKVSLMFSKAIQHFDNFSLEAEDEERRLNGEEGYPSDEE